ncbi:aspartate-semialdehyde dehydrogenase [Piscirickettsia salmonis]|uniref:Aspartate-semialdehyde dehydrogenase n=1 Tax=Piscirickettsia salmonis TaxID=1238 RepID=A0A9Q6PWL9_PISSA|nr:aspartate-semialdehyde dehydrogenase [Piscirickettsia salmonis]ALA24860.1 aspartate-semialdehyde dehydrogenase [Piscirickettsia salmonis]APS45177.1 aspartate-semialdehyde dehydrogenase [Piscirickettsia salmonis]APS48537.1 aspartate-semialdehyde dehydrogenase [Piscirickettsia salmonis]APS49798.1 aspartate-semialdehyde dehydrogenase [Piscirickettsia salmonis]APS52983.1 aspartate-semialdehyde dehydrogenase [Piscirickettsia salmonis]
MKKYSVAIVGATGAVGETLLELLAERQFPIARVYPLASERSAGTTATFGHQTLIVESLAEFDFSQVDIAFFSAGADISHDYVPKATAAGAVVIDNSSCFRYDDDVPLVVPEVNADAIKQYKLRHIIANPNCSTIQMVVALKPLYDAVGIERINVATYQAVSGTGRQALEELVHQTANLLNAKPVQSKVYPKQIAFNVLPHIDRLEENGYTFEEMKMVRETQKILADSNIKINPTAVRVPVFYGHAEAINIETKEKITAAGATELLKHAMGVKVIDGRDENFDYPTPVTEASGKDAVYVGRIREDISCERGINLWVVADNVRKGAALNAIQIAEYLIKHELNK